MNEKRTDFVTIMCWIALILGGLILVIFIISMLLDVFSAPSNNKNNTTTVQVEVNENNPEIEVKEDEYISSGNENTKIATTTTHSNYMNGYNDGTFAPYGGLSRAEVAAVLARLDKKFNENSLKEEMSKMVAQRKIEIYDNYIIVNNIELLF